MMSKKKIVYLAPHLSTGGMPQFVLKRIEAMLKLKEFEIYLIEYTQYSTAYVVQREQLQAILGDRFYSLGYLNQIDTNERGRRLKEKLNEIGPDIVHIDEAPESFDSFNKMGARIQKWLYTQSWKVVETCHNIWFEPSNKRLDPDQYQMCTPYHLETFGQRQGLKHIVEYPIENLSSIRLQAKEEAQNTLGFDTSKTHVLNVGLWTEGKNQKEGVEIARIALEQNPNLHFHFVGNQAENFETYWGPIMQDVPANVTVWGERSDVHMFMIASDAFMFNSTWECSPLALREAASYGLKTFARNLPQYKDMFTQYIVPFSDDLEENASILLKELSVSDITGENPPQDDFSRFINQLKEAYHATLDTPKATIKQALEWRLRWHDGLRLYIDQLDGRQWRAEFWDGQDLVYSTGELEEDYWYSPSRKWWTNWTIRIYADSELQIEEEFTLEGQDLTVEFGSSSLGDTLSFMGQMHSVKQRHAINRLYVKCHKPWLFNWHEYNAMGIYQLNWDQESTYHMATVGVYYTMEEQWKRHEHKYDWRQVPLGKIASDRLDLEYIEQRPHMAPIFTNAKSSSDRAHIVIATQSTAQAKYWNNPTGWQDLTKWCNDNEIDVYHASKEGNPPEGSIQLPEALEEVAAHINTARAFVGISSGLSWFAWALGAQVLMISGFTDEYVEFEDRCTRVINKQACHGCWGWDAFDRGDWNWCPAWKNTHRQFECSKTISSEQVIETLKSII
jgi:autotransporter strand-loop-strand O-heptosyltransferase